MEEECFKKAESGTMSDAGTRSGKQRPEGVTRSGNKKAVHVLFGRSNLGRDV